MSTQRTFWPCIIVSVSAFALFGGIALQVSGDNGLTQLDRSVAADLRDHANGSPLLKTVSNVLSFIGSAYLLGPLCLLVAALMVRRRNYDTALAWLAALLVGSAMNWGIKRFVHRLRPFMEPGDTDWSFPSGHSMNS